MTTILLVEDEIGLAKVIIEELEQGDYEVLHAADGVTALHLHEQQQVDLIILDWMIPALDGLEVLRRLRRVSLVPVLMLTARADESDRVIGLELGADDYLTKPFSMRELVARVHALLRRVERVQRIVNEDRAKSKLSITYQSLALDPNQYRVTVGDNLVDLTRLEFDLLHLLLRNPGRVFSRVYLLDTVWDEVYVGGDRSVDNAMLRLRKKLGDMGDVIETVWGVGYRLRKKE
ncbi:MAG: response regulator transcription factor [Anaerolineae bacterium]|nr:response regulator transcription factor [Anaerolineae bacterium]